MTKTYDVTVTRWVEVQEKTVIQVTANSDDEARAKALETAKQQEDDWDEIDGTEEANDYNVELSEIADE